MKNIFQKSFYTETNGTFVNLHRLEISAEFFLDIHAYIQLPLFKRYFYFLTTCSCLQIQGVQGGMKRKRMVGKIGRMTGKCSKATWGLNRTTLTLTLPCVYQISQLLLYLSIRSDLQFQVVLKKRLFYCNLKTQIFLHF
jgi:hypothetical protein